MQDAAPKPLHLIVACAENRVIGLGGRLPWHIAEDTAFFHAATAGQTVVLGRICYETWPQVRSEGRHPVVISRNSALAQAGVHVTPTFTSALDLADTLPGKIMICGGERIYAEALACGRPLRLQLTLIHAEIAGDTFMPDWRHLPWRELSRRESADANHRYTFFELSLP
jgi:dihydrofolate reductase